jgi:hypothetical protein
MLEAVDPEDLQSRLWDMFPYMMRGVMSLPQLDRVRWIMFPAGARAARARCLTTPRMRGRAARASCA